MTTRVLVTNANQRSAVAYKCPLMKLAKEMGITQPRSRHFSVPAAPSSGWIRAW